MSTDAEIRFFFEDEISPTSLLTQLIHAGWGVDLDGSLSLISGAAPGDSEWALIERGDTDYLLRWAQGLENSNDFFGFLLVHQESHIGGTMMVDASRKMLAWGISVNIPYLPGGGSQVDFPKCLALLSPTINFDQSRIARFETRCDR